eukprot:gene12013-14044_t
MAQRITSLPIVLEKYIVELCWNKLEFRVYYKFLVALGLVSKRWFRWSSEAIGAICRLHSYRDSLETAVRHLDSQWCLIKTIPKYLYRNTSALLQDTDDTRRLISSLLVFKYEAFYSSHIPMPEKMLTMLRSNLMATSGLLSLTIRDPKFKPRTLEMLDPVTRFLTKLKITVKIDTFNATHQSLLDSIYRFIAARSDQLMTLALSLYPLPSPAESDYAMPTIGPFFSSLFSLSYSSLKKFDLASISLVPASNMPLHRLTPTLFPSLTELRLQFGRGDIPNSMLKALGSMTRLHKLSIRLIDHTLCPAIAALTNLWQLKVKGLDIYSLEPSVTQLELPRSLTTLDMHIYRPKVVDQPYTPPFITNLITNNANNLTSLFLEISASSFFVNIMPLLLGHCRNLVTFQCQLYFTMIDGQQVDFTHLSAALVAIPTIQHVHLGDVNSEHSFLSLAPLILSSLPDTIRITLTSSQAKSTAMNDLISRSSNLGIVESSNTRLYLLTRGPVQ